MNEEKKDFGANSKTKLPASVINIAIARVDNGFITTVTTNKEGGETLMNDVFEDLAEYRLKNKVQAILGMHIDGHVKFKKEREQEERAEKEKEQVKEEEKITKDDGREE